MQRELDISFPLTKEFGVISNELDTGLIKYGADRNSSGAGFGYRDMQFELDNSVNEEAIMKTVKDILNKYFKEGDYKVSIYDLDDNGDYKVSIYDLDDNKDEDEEFKLSCTHCNQKNCEERVENFIGAEVERMKDLEDGDIVIKL